jgi:hypothetical protein
MKIENVQVYGLSASIRAMRNPKNSWGLSDSYKLKDHRQFSNNYAENTEEFVLGKKDTELSSKLTKAGTEHCKHLRLTNVWFDVTAPRYWFLEFDTYKHKENVSCSTMHKITSRILDFNDFEKNVSEETIKNINNDILRYQGENNSIIKQEIFLEIKSNLPEGYLQKRTVVTNYQTLYSMYQQRKNHRLPQWKEFCKFILSLPYFKELTGLSEDR